MVDKGNACVFCKIIAGQIPSLRVFENEHCVAFLDIGPLASGHTLLVPRVHVESLWDFDPSVAASVVSRLPELSRAIMQATGAGGLNVLQSNGRVAGQVVPHVHFHLIPRQEGDSLGFRWPARSYGAGEAEAVQQKIAAALR